MYYAYNPLNKKLNEFFDVLPSHTHFLESSTHNSAGNYEKIAINIHQDWPHSKIIYIVRDYLDKLSSLKYQLAFMGTMTPKEASQILDNQYYVKQFMYESCASWYASLFGHDNIYVVRYEDLINRPTEVLNQIQIFLRLKPIDLALPSANLTSHKTHLPNSTAVLLHKLSLHLGVYPFVSERIRNRVRALFSAKADKCYLNDLFALKDFDIDSLRSIINADRTGRLRSYGIIETYTQSIELRSGIRLGPVQ